jgi:phosphatidylinositol glycan class U
MSDWFLTRLLVQEGLFLYTRNVSPYDGGVYHQVRDPPSINKLSSNLPSQQAPLLLPLFSLLPNPRDFPLPTAVFYSLIDLVNANALVTIAESRQSVASRLHSALRKDVRWDGAAIAAWYERVFAYVCAR